MWEEDPKIEKRKAGCRIALIVCILLMCVLFVLAAVALAAVFVPRTPAITVTGVTMDTFNIEFCPHQSESTVSCCNATGCYFNYNQQKFNATGVLSYKIQNGNLFTIKAKDLNAQLLFGNELVAQTLETNVVYDANVEKTYTTTLIWKNITNTSMQSILCGITKSNQNHETSNLITFDFNFYLNLYYFTLDLKFSPMIGTFQVNFPMCTGKTNCNIDINSNLCK
ncbi:hypothetical protein ABK040_006968 [Willaertia magna]